MPTWKLQRNLFNETKAKIHEKHHDGNTLQEQLYILDPQGQQIEENDIKQ